jgi:multicomponent Na+:H+ antiporter subunit B
MHSLLLSTAIRLLLPLLLMFSIFLLLRGHNDPGGGFVGGLVAAAAFVLHALAHGVDASRKILRVNPRLLVALGLLIALLSGILSIFSELPFLTGIWFSSPLPVIGHAGTPLIFDSGVYLVVAGMALMIVYSLMEG